MQVHFKKPCMIVIHRGSAFQVPQTYSEGVGPQPSSRIQTEGWMLASVQMNEDMWIVHWKKKQWCAVCCYPACSRCFPSPMHLIQMITYQAPAELSDELIIWIRWRREIAKTCRREALENRISTPLMSIFQEKLNISITPLAGNFHNTG